MRPRRTLPDLPGERLEPARFGPAGRQLTLAAVFGDRFAGAALHRELLLQTEEMHRVLRRDYFHLCRMLNSIARTRGYPGVDAGRMNQAEAGIAASIQAARETVAGRRSALMRRFERHPEACASVDHARATRFQAPVASPLAMQFLDAVAAADECSALSTAAWLQGLVPPQEHHGLRRQLRRALAAVKAQVTVTRAQCLRLRTGGDERSGAPTEPPRGKERMPT